MSDVTVLAQQLREGQVAQRQRAAEQLAQSGENAAPAAVELVQAAGDEEQVREWAVAALEQLGPPPTAAIRQLCGLTAHENELVGYWAVTLLGRLGPAAVTAVSALTDTLQHSPHQAVRQRAAWALGQVGDGSATVIAALTRAAGAEDPRLARLATQALAQLQ
jgi:HEAT repeat protein